MNKTKNILAISFGILFASGVAKAEFKAGPFTLTPGILFESNYVGEFNGSTSNRTQPTYGADIGISHDSSGAYIYSAVKKLKNYPDADNVANGTFDNEFCNSLGLANKIQALNYDVSYENCYVERITAQNTGTFYFRLNSEVTKGTTIGAAYAKDSTDGNAASVGLNPQFGEDAYKVFVSHDLAFAKATVTYGEANDYSKFYSVGLNKDYFGVNFDLSYWNVDLDNWAMQTALQHDDRDLLVLKAKKTF
jgi:hypothetical protein